MSIKMQLTDGSPVPADGSHKQLGSNGMQRSYVVLSPEERAKGFVKPVRKSYIHANPSELDRKVGCGGETRMGSALAETYARDPNFYSGTFCIHCSHHFPLNQFVWDDGEPMDPDLQEAWAATEGERRRKVKLAHCQNRCAQLRSDLAQAEKELERLTSG